MAPTGKRTVTSLPPQAQLTALKVERLAFTGWRFLEDHPLPDAAGGIQVRDGSSLAPKGNVGLYAENMKAGDLFPPVVVTADGYQIDGRTRNLAKRSITRKGQTPVFDAIVLAENFEDITTAQMDKFYILAAVLNDHGEKLTDRNKEKVISQVWHDGMSQIDLARMLGVHPNTVKAVVNAKKARERLGKLAEARQDDTEFGKLNRTTLSVLETKGSKLYDRPFYEVAQVTVRAGMQGTEVSELLTELNELHDEDRQMELLEGVRQQRKLQIDGVVRSNPLATQAMRSMGWFKKYADDPSVLAATAGPQVKQDMIDRCWEISGLLRKLAQGMENELAERN
jgi:CENP-B N-terminal DNA-binding domain